MLAAAERSVNVHVSGDKWWVTAAVAVGAALLGSFAGAAGTYYASVGLEGRRRKALAEIRRKAKVYTPIRAELVSLRRAIGEGRHAGYQGILRERPEYQTMVPAPVLVIWREFVEDGRANTTASARVTAALGRVDAAADSSNDAMTVARGTFKERGEAIAEQSGFSPAVTNWYEREFQALIRHGLRSSGAFSDPFADGPGAEPPHTLTPDQDEFLRLWEADDAVRGATEALVAAEKALNDAIPAAIAELDAAMKRIADKYEHEPD
jgi:hypothetical protein